jgi:hypothetical protein
MDELHGIFTAYEMRTEQENLDVKEKAFKASKRSKQKKRQQEEHSNNSDDSEDDEEVANFVKRLNKGTNDKYRGKLPLICFNCDGIGHFANKCSHKKNRNDEGYSKGNQTYKDKRTTKKFFKKILCTKNVLSEIGNEKCCLGKEDESWLWHIRMGQIHFDNLVKVSKREAVREMSQITKPTNTLCKHCQQGKQTKTRVKSKEYSTTRPLKIVHTNLVGPTTTKGLNGDKYFMLLVDDYTRMTAVCFLKNKSEAFENFKICKEMVENELDSKIKCLRSDNGGEFTSKEFMDYCNNHGIKRQFSIARTPQHNGVVERKNTTVYEMLEQY